jgi:hypothetical protein
MVGLDGVKIRDVHNISLISAEEQSKLWRM